MSTLYEAEVREQPDVLRRLLTEGRGAAEAVAERIATHAPRFVVIAARGSSDNAARYGQYVFGIHNGLVAALATPSVFTHYHGRPSLQDALVIGISQSGQSPDIVEVVREGRRQGASTVAITNEAESPLAREAELGLALHAGNERAVAATKTYTAQVMALAMLSAALRHEKEPWDELARVPELVHACIETNAPRVQVAEHYREHNRLIVAGRGYNLSTAFEITLKVKETTGVMADGYSSADFLHGPRALLDRGIPVLAVSPGRAFSDLDDIVRLTQELGDPLIAVSDREEMLRVAEVALPMPAGTPDWLSPLVAIVPGQLWALALSLSRGMSPDAPIGLTKVTHTR